MTEAQVSVLVVDDNDAQRLALRAILGGLDVALVEAESGRHALRCLLQQEFAVILLDVNMPGLDGFETAALIRERRSPSTPIISRDRIRRRCVCRSLSLGAVGSSLAPVQPTCCAPRCGVHRPYKKTEPPPAARSAVALCHAAPAAQRGIVGGIRAHSTSSAPWRCRRIIGARRGRATAAAQEAATPRSDAGTGRRQSAAVERGAMRPPALRIERPQRMTQASSSSRSVAHCPSELITGVALRAGWRCRWPREMVGPWA